ncbi:MAG: YggS family pyridoxal phosphate-dependent enzyme [Mesonia hippocampi]|uniref:YggS family pyridoxal phosphate-dependent enzyme n=1 Tax=Mesonia hippocampi TaxID=1628250 RepID=UPI003F989B52
MNSISENIKKYLSTLPKHVQLVAVSKTKPTSEILEAYNAGQRIFGENKVQELTEKHEELPKDIEWHMIGHLQRNKVKYIAPFVSLIHAVDSLKLLKEINKQAAKNNRKIACLLQVKIAKEDSKFGLSEEDLSNILTPEEIQKLPYVNIIGLMGMATFTNNKEQVADEFASLKKIFDQQTSKFPNLKILSMGMSNDYNIAITQGSTMVRIGSAIFGNRNYKN